MRRILIQPATLLLLTMLATPAAGRAGRVSSAAAEARNPEVRVVNNHAERIRVVVVDAGGAHHSLGHVAPRKARVFQLGTDDIRTAIQVKVVVDAPAWSAGNTGEAVRSDTMTLADADAVYVWIEPELAETSIEVVR